MALSRFIRRALRLAIISGLAVATNANAHDLWLQPQSFHVPADAMAPTTVFVGHGGARQIWGVPISRVRMLRSIGPQGVVDQRPALRPDSLSKTIPIQLTTPGVHVLIMESGYAESTLPALRFTEYLKAEGLTPALAIRAKSRSQNLPGKEIYSRRAKALIKVGEGKGPQPQVTTPVGMRLEIVPERNPLELKAGDRLPVRVLYEGQPLAGALVKLTNLADDSRPVESHLTDRAGRTTFRSHAGGAWLLNVLWTKPLVGNPQAQFDTTFSSLTFSFGE